MAKRHDCTLSKGKGAGFPRRVIVTRITHKSPNNALEVRLLATFSDGGYLNLTPPKSKNQGKNEDQRGPCVAVFDSQVTKGPFSGSWKGWEPVFDPV